MAALMVVRGPVRLRPAPAYEPPYDDERSADWWGPGALQPLLELPAPFDPEPATDRPALWASPRPGASPPAAAAATQFAHTCLEILNGYRPVAHFRALAHPLEAAAVLAAMSQAYRRLRQATGRGEMLLRRRTMRTCEPRPGIAEVALVIGADPPPRTRTLARIRSPAGSSMRTTPAATARGADRGAAPAVWALAYRLEQRHGRWLCTAAQLL